VKRLVEEETGKRLRESMTAMKEALEALDRSLLPEQKDVMEELGRFSRRESWNGFPR